MFVMKRTFFNLITAAALTTFMAHAQTVEAGARIDIRTNQTINTKNASSRVFDATVAQDVVGTDGRVVIPRGSPAELVVIRTGKNNLTVDLQSVTVNGRQYAVDTNEIDRGSKAGVGANSRTAKYVGGGAVLGTVLGAIAGGGKGAAIGALAGGAAGAGTQILTKGRAVKIPAESVLTFRLEQPMTVSRHPRRYRRQ